jgi:hypothetical protein
LNEFLHYSFSGWSTLQEYKDHFLEELQGWGAKDVTDQKKVLQVVNQGAERWSNEGRPEHGQKPPVPTTRREPKVPTAKCCLKSIPEVAAYDGSGVYGRQTLPWDYFTLARDSPRSHP